MLCIVSINSPSINRHIDDCIDESWELIACPGGMPGATNLRDSDSLRTLLVKQSENNKLIGAICASPAVILAHHGLIGSLETEMTHYNLYFFMCFKDFCMLSGVFMYAFHLL